MERNLGKFPDSMDFLSCKINIRTEVCLQTADLQLTILWMAKGMGSPRHVHDRRRRTREGPEPACVQTPLHGRWHTRGRRMN